jgi:hypothetical protein
MPLTLKEINSELAKRGHNTLLQKGSGYFYFRGGEAGGWLDKTVRVPKVSSLTLEQWLGEFERLRKLNGEIMKAKPRRKR